MIDDRKFSQSDERVGGNARRAFLRTLRNLFALLGAGSVFNVSAAKSALAFKPAAFEADKSSVLLWLSAEDSLDAVIEHSSSADLANAVRSTTVNLRQTTDFTQSVLLSGLAAGTEFHYRIVATDGRELFKGGRFRTAPETGAKFSVAFTGDMGAEFQPFKLLEVIANANPHLFLHLGDTVYADRPKKDFSPSVRHYRRKHAEIRKDAPLQRLLTGVSTSAIWDDHEIEDNCHGGNPNFPEAMQVFREYWPVRGAIAEVLYRRIHWGGCDFFILDTRRFRSPQTAPDGADKTMLGTTQKAWLLAELKNSSAAFKFIVSSVPFHAGGEDTWSSYAMERDEIAAFIKKSKITRVVILSADYHMARDWSSAKTGLKEFMVGPIAYKTQYEMNPSSRERHEKSGKFAYNGYNFGLLNIDTGATPPKAVLQIIDIDGRVRFEKDLSA